MLESIRKIFDRQQKPPYQAGTNLLLLLVLSLVIGAGVSYATLGFMKTFEHVVNCLCKIIPGMSSDRAWKLAHRIDGEGSAEVWCGPLEQAELYHQQLSGEGLTMAPIERC